MADNKVDQGKVKSDAEKLATPDAPTKPVTTEATAPPVSSETATKSVEDQLLKQFGPGYVKVKKGNQETTFSARAWDLLGDNKEGWKPITQKPPEVQQLEAKKAGEPTK